MPQEVALIKRTMSIERIVTIGVRTFLEGSWAGRPIVLALSRYGKVAAATTTALLIERFRATHIIFTGVAGAVDPRLNVGDIVVASQLVQHDMDARPLFPRFEIPFMGRTRLDSALADEAGAAARVFVGKRFPGGITSAQLAAFGMTTPAIHTGLVASGDQFIASQERVVALREALPGVLCVEMEGAAVAQVCHELGDVPMAVIRVMSDRADQSAFIDFQRFVDEVGEHLTCGVAQALVERL